MPEHVHLLLSEPQRGTLADALKSLKQGVSRRLIGDAEHFWQKRYYDFNIRNHRQFVEKLRYIHRNPVKRGLCDARKTESGVVIASMRRAMRDAWRLNASVQPWNCPTQANIRLEWATRPMPSGPKSLS